MMMATPMMQHTPNATTTPALAVEVGGSSLLFVFKVLLLCRRRLRRRFSRLDFWI
jgi:hypothetical protein